MKTRDGYVSNSSTTSFLIVGLPIDEETARHALMREVQERGCSHGGLPQGAKFCPVCAKPAFVNRMEFVKGVKPGEDGELNKAKIGEVTLTIEGPEGEEQLYAAIRSKGGTVAFMPIEGLAELKQKTKLALEPFGLWNEKRFGIYGGGYYNG